MKKLVLLSVSLSILQFSTAFAALPIKIEKRDFSSTSCYYIESGAERGRIEAMQVINGLTEGGATDIRIRNKLNTGGSCGESDDIRHYSVSGTYEVYTVKDWSHATVQDLGSIKTVTKKAQATGSCWYIYEGSTDCDREAQNMTSGLSAAGAFDIDVQCQKETGSCADSDNVPYYSVEGTYKVNTIRGVQVPHVVIESLFSDPNRLVRAMQEQEGNRDSRVSDRVSADKHSDSSIGPSRSENRTNANQLN